MHMHRRHRNSGSRLSAGMFGGEQNDICVLTEWNVSLLTHTGEAEEGRKNEGSRPMTFASVSGVV